MIRAGRRRKPCAPFVVSRLPGAARRRLENIHGFGSRTARGIDQFLCHRQGGGTQEAHLVHPGRARQGRKVLNQYTRYLTVFLAIFQAYGIAIGLEGQGGTVAEPGWFFRISTVLTLTGGIAPIVTARNLLRLCLCDAVITGGADSLCKLTLNGFASLESATASLCNPMSRNRCGINVGEAAALFVLRREHSDVALLGAGASSDAYHISSPDPSGRGAEAAMREAFRDASLDPLTGLGYLNLHATATPKNDEMESLATARVFPGGVPCSGTKPLTGHTLGASAATELAFCWLTLHPGWNPGRRLPPHRWDEEADPALPSLRLTDSDSRLEGPGLCMSNAFAFGGNNLSLLIGAAP